jgi:ATP-binding protein involved in chromosome partitioning
MTVENEFADTLDRIADPVTGKGLVAAGRVPRPNLRDGVATVVLNVDGLSGDAVTRIEREIRVAASAVSGVAEARIVRTAERRDRRFIAVASGKGGVGKSTVAANLAVGLGRLGMRAGLIDADIHGPSVPTLLGTAERPHAIDKKLIPLEAHGIRALSVGMMIDTDRAVAWRGPMVSGALNQMIVDAEWGDTDPIVLDLPPGTGDIQLTLIQKHRPAGAVIVSTPQDLALIDARRGIDLFRQTGIPIIGLIENMSGYACPSCGALSHPFGTGGVEDTCAELGVPFLGRVPLDMAIRTASDAGQPPVLGEGPQAEAFMTIARKVAATLS